MTDRKDGKWLDDKIARATDLGPARFDAQQWKQKYILDESRRSAVSYRDYRPHKNVWRIIMESKITRYSAAAVIVMAMALVLLSPFGTPGNGGIVLADVQQKVGDVETMVIRGRKTYSHAGKDGEVFEFLGIKYEFDVTKYFSKQHGLVEEGYVEDDLMYRATFNRSKQRTLVILPPVKKYVVFTSTDKQGQLLENLTPNGIVDLLLGSDYNKLGRDNIDGVEVEGFEFQEADPFVGLLPKSVFDIQNLEGKVWIGTREQLPVRVEANLAIGRSLLTVFNDLNLHEINILEKCNVDLDENIFDTKPPEGYTEVSLTDILSLIPAQAKAGLVGLGVVPAGLIVWKCRRRKASRK